MKFLLVCSISLTLLGCTGGNSDQDNTSVISQNAASFANDADSSTRERLECTSNAVNHGDGWGWDNGTSCRWGDSTLPTQQARSSTPECTHDAVNHGDGWGWENDDSCRWGDSTMPAAGQTAAAPIVTTTAVLANDAASTDSNTSGNHNSCSANALDNGNGWGWEYGEPCLWGDTRPATQSSTYVPAPVSLQAPGYINGKPICLTDTSDGNDDGFGYENNRTCAVVEGRTATSANPLLNQRWCQHWAEISYGDYVLQNNTWNDSEVYSDNWHQCIELTGSAGNYVAKWDYNWLEQDEGNEYSVKSYPQVYYGRKTRNTASGTPEKLGLPAPLNAIPDYKVRFKYSETGNPERNVALESFFHTSCEAEEWNKQFELMVWVGIPVTKAPGPKVAEVTIDGFGWDVHTNPKLGWGYVAFVAQQPMTEGWLDWSAFVNWTRFDGPAYGVPRIQNNTCMGAIEIGTETFWGKGTFTLHEFRVTR